MNPQPKRVFESRMQATIDGRTIHAEPGATIYTAATDAGTSIPSLCASRHLAPYGSCRLCVCEVDGLKGLQAACSVPLQDGMIIRTESVQLHRHRRNLIELYISEQPAGEPAYELRELAKRYDLTKIRYTPGATRAAMRDESSPFFRFDNQLCISCARCMRACDEIQPAFAVSMVGAGFSSRPAWGIAGLTGSGGIASSTACHAAHA
jgi:formate dehydrogenase major subunit